MSFYRIISILIGTFSLVFFCSIPSASAQKSTSIDEGNALLWRLEGQQIKQPSYVFGTIHMIGQKDFVLWDKLEKVANKVDSHIYEIDLTDQEAMIKASMSSLLPNNQSLKTLMDSSAYSKLKKHCLEEVGISEMEFIAYERMKPIFLQQMLMPNVLGDDPASYEMELIQIAQKKGIAIKGLESIDMQMAILDSIPLKDQIQGLMDGLEGDLDAEKLFSKMVESYLAQDVNALLKLMDSAPELMKHQASLLDNRNERWIAQIEDFATAGSCLFAVGAAHLPGDKGVVSLLTQKGYKLTPIRM